jgi:hypothetical protein
LEPVVDGASGQAEAEDDWLQIGRENWFLETDTKTDTKGHSFVFLDGEEFLFGADHKGTGEDWACFEKMESKIEVSLGFAGWS